MDTFPAVTVAVATAVVSIVKQAVWWVGDDLA